MRRMGMDLWGDTITTTYQESGFFSLNESKIYQLPTSIGVDVDVTYLAAAAELDTSVRVVE
jgi:hypothetical protein